METAKAYPAFIETSFSVKFSHFCISNAKNFPIHMKIWQVFRKPNLLTQLMSKNRHWYRHPLPYVWDRLPKIRDEGKNLFLPLNLTQSNNIEQINHRHSFHRNVCIFHEFKFNASFSAIKFVEHYQRFSMEISRNLFEIFFGFFFVFWRVNRICFTWCTDMLSK